MIFDYNYDGPVYFDAGFVGVGKIVTLQTAADGTHVGRFSRFAAGAAAPLSLLEAFEAERHRWFLWIPVLIGGGIGLYFSLPVEPSLRSALLALVAAIVLAALCRNGSLRFALSRALLAVAIGFTVAKIRSDQVATPVIERPTRSVDVRGHVELVEPLATRGQRLTLRATSISGFEPTRIPRRVRIRVLNPLAGLKPGDAIAVKARLSPPGEPVLPGGYDFGRRAWFLGIGAVGYAFDQPRLDPTAAPPPDVLQAAAAIERVRLAIGAAVTSALPGQSGAIANALLTGDRGGIDRETDKAFRDSGLYHVLSISGLHMTVMAGTLFFAVRYLLAAIPGLAVRVPVKIWAAVIAALGALGYLLISGGAFATLRSYVMISIIFLAIIVERPALALRNVALAALAMLLIWPESLLDPGFQMSFAAVTALIAAGEAWRAREERLGRDRAGPRGALSRVMLFLVAIAASTLIAGAAVAPLAAYHFHTSQQYSIIGNVLALPLCDLVVMPALLATLVMMPFGLEAYPLALAGWGIDAMSAVAGYVGRLPGAVAAIPSISLSGLLAMAGGGLWLMLWTGRWRLFGLLAIVVGLAIAPMRTQPDIIVGRDGTLVAARVDGRRLAVVRIPTDAAARSKLGDIGQSAKAAGDPASDHRQPTSAASNRPAGGTFELARWLEADGDSRPAASLIPGAGFRCDGVGCRAIVNGRSVAIVWHRAGMADDCQRADIVILTGAKPKSCTKPELVIDAKARRAGGVHAITVAKAGAIKVETVAASRGVRPWSGVAPTQSATRPRSATTGELDIDAGDIDTEPMDPSESPGNSD